MIHTQLGKCIIFDTVPILALTSHRVCVCVFTPDFSGVSVAPTSEVRTAANLLLFMVVPCA